MTFYFLCVKIKMEKLEVAVVPLFLMQIGGMDMPMKPRKPCGHAGCPNLTYNYYCDEHEQLHRGDRMSSGKRGYGSKWQKKKSSYLRRHPLCCACLQQGVYTKATVVDHIIPHRGDKFLFWDESNWQSMCKPCHDKKTGNYDSKPTYDYRF